MYVCCTGLLACKVLIRSIDVVAGRLKRYEGSMVIFRNQGSGIEVSCPYYFLTFCLDEFSMKRSWS